MTEQDLIDITAHAERCDWKAMQRDLVRLVAEVRRLRAIVDSADRREHLRPPRRPEGEGPLRGAES